MQTEANTRSLPYQHDAAMWANRFADLPGFVFLDSRKRRAEVGQYDIITACPDAVYRLMDYAGNTHRWMADIEAHVADAPQAGRSRLAVGFLDYDSAASASGVPGEALRPAAAGVYCWYILQDHQLGRCWLITDDHVDPETLNAVERRLSKDTALSGVPANMPEGFCLDSPFKPQTPKHEYLAAIERIREYIGAGDCYQVNYAHRFAARCSGAAFSAYLALRDVAPGDFSAFISLSPDHAVLSLSPERFLSIESGRVKTQPIKGTRPRGRNPVDDARLAEELRNSDKDRAENVMIVDLLRNDLGRVCDSGTVVTTELCMLHSFDNVHHLVSMVEGRLQPKVTPGQALLACSPGGSITGAPKRRAMEIIRELESAPRGVYCGSVFVLGSDGWLQSSIAIRTLEILGQDIYCWGGGGIVHDSEAESEYQETLDKVGVFMRTLDSGCLAGQ